MPPDMVDKINLSFGRLIGLGRSAEYPEEHLISGPEPFDVGRCAVAVLLELGWRRKRIWSTSGQYHRYWEPPPISD